MPYGRGSDLRRPQCHTSQAAVEAAPLTQSRDKHYGEPLSGGRLHEYGNDDGRLHQGKGSARALHPAAGPALYKTGPVDCHRVPTSAPPGRKDGFYLHHDVEDVCRSDRRAAGVGEESAQGARSCDLEGNRAGLGCLEHLRNALSFAVVTEWPVGVYPRRRRWSPPHACLVRAVGQSSPCECMSVGHYTFV